mmetsp:Transcript_24628/g.67095  ORF Transcript_24628/g.67095 Transcript_24628/m.67095 type:complete len:207 (+) Transcript_24628:412-1032(+)
MCTATKCHRCSSPPNNSSSSSHTWCYTLRSHQSPLLPPSQTPLQNPPSRCTRHLTSSPPATFLLTLTPKHPLPCLISALGSNSSTHLHKAPPNHLHLRSCTTTLLIILTILVLRTLHPARPSPGQTCRAQPPPLPPLLLLMSALHARAAIPLAPPARAAVMPEKRKRTLRARTITLLIPTNLIMVGSWGMLGEKGRISVISATGRI